LQNAHCVDFGASIKVKRRGSDQKYVAKVEAMGPECDIGGWMCGWICGSVRCRNCAAAFMEEERKGRS